MFKGIDLSSDTATRPSEAMRKSIAAAVVGDEQRGEDPTTRALEAKVADLLGQETALFLPSATLANELALRLHCQPGEEILAAENCHLFTAEAGGPAVHANALSRPIPTTTGIFTAQDLDERFFGLPSNYQPRTAVISVENTSNMGGGIAWPINNLKEVISFAKTHNTPLHLDGARLFNAVVATKTPAQVLAEDFDTVTICLSKGLGCPAGAVLAMRKPFAHKARFYKQQMGGSLRQSGILAAAGLYALEHNIERLAVDHENARRLATALCDMPQVTVENPKPSTNMVFFTVSGMPAEKFLESTEAVGVRFSRVGKNRLRAVTHMDVATQDIEDATQRIHSVLESA